MFLTCREPGVPVSLFRPYPLPFSPPFLLYCSLPFLFFYVFFSLIYICCSFRGGILSVVFPTVAICFWPAGNLECPCLFSDLILFSFLLLFFYIVPFPSFPFLVLFFYIVPYPSFSSMSFSLIYICCSFWGGILSAVFPTVARCFWPAGNLECPSLFRPLFPFLLLFFLLFLNYSSFSSMSFSLIYICCSFRESILFVVFPTPDVSLQGTWSARVSFPPWSSSLFSSFSAILLLTLPFLLCLFFIDLYLLQFPGRHSICCFPTVAIFSDPQGTWSARVSFPTLSSSLFSSFSSILFLTLPFLLCLFFIDLYLLQFPGRHSICCFPHCSHMLLTRREPGVPLSLFRPYPLLFSPPFLLYCSFSFLFSYAFFIDLYLL